MFVLVAPTLLVFSTGFALIGFLAGFFPFLLMGLPGVLIGLVGIGAGLLRKHRSRFLLKTGTPVLVEPQRPEINRSLNLSGTAMRMTCLGTAPPAFRGRAFETHWFLGPTDWSWQPPGQLVAYVDEVHPEHYLVDLSPYGIAASRLPRIRTLAAMIGIFAFGILSAGVGAHLAGTGGPGIQPVQANGDLSISLHATATAGAGQAWSLHPNSCLSTQPQSLYGVTLQDNKAKGGNTVTLFHDQLQGDVIDADIPGQNKDLRFFLNSDCPGSHLDLKTMNSTVNHVTNLQGSLDAQCANAAGELRGHMTFQFCH